MRVGHGTDDAGDDVVEQVKRCLGLKRAVVRLRPQARTSTGVDQLNSYTNFAARLANAAFHHVMGAQFPRRGAHINRLLCIASG